MSDGPHIVPFGVNRIGSNGQYVAWCVAAVLLMAGCDSVPARAADLFAPIYAVLQHPRCANCHADGTAPLQRDGRPHLPAVQRGPEGKGSGSQPCANCHKDHNTASAPGAPNWQMPTPYQPMVFRGRSAAALCRQLVDPTQNGGKDAEALGRHFAKDPLLGWAWNPGAGRAPPPLARDRLVAAVAAWLRAGAPCPEK